MEYVLYLDVWFLTDVFLNLLALFLTAVLLKKPIHFIRIWSAAILGSLWGCVFVLYPMQSSVAELLLTIAVAGSTMVRIAFDKDDVIIMNLALLLASAVLNGCLAFVREQFLLHDWECLAVAAMLTACAGILIRDLLRSGEIGNQRFSVRLYHQGKERTFTALADSGNRLRVPESQKAVSLISYEDCRGFCEQVSGGIFIPYRAVGTDHGLLFAITFEKMEIEKNGICKTIENPVVAITKEPLSSGGDFNMLLPEEYVLEISDYRNRRRKSS